MKPAAIEIIWDEIGSAWYCDAMHRGFRVARAVCWLEGDVLTINDLSVDKEGYIPWPFAHDWIVLSIDARVRNFRGRGIGSLLLDEIISKADIAGVRQIRGSIIPRDIEETPHLLDWYRSQGFQVSEPDSECIDVAEKMISRIHPAHRV